MTTTIAFVDRDEAVALAQAEKAVSAIEAEITKLTEQVEKAKADLAVSEQVFKSLRENLAGKQSS